MLMRLGAQEVAIKLISSPGILRARPDPKPARKLKGASRDALAGPRPARSPAVASQTAMLARVHIAGGAIFVDEFQSILPVVRVNSAVPPPSPGSSNGAIGGSATMVVGDAADALATRAPYDSAGQRSIELALLTGPQARAGAVKEGCAASLPCTAADNDRRRGVGEARLFQVSRLAIQREPLAWKVAVLIQSNFARARHHEAPTVVLSPQGA